MKIKVAIRTSILAIIGTSLVACGASLEEYQKFALAGQEYASALDSLLVTSGNYFIDANSEILLRTDFQEPDRDSDSYSKLTKNDEEWLALIGQMRQHTSLLKQYFLSLDTLASSNAPQQAREATEKIFVQLNSISASIQQSPLIPEGVSSALPSVTQIILSQKIKGALREELELRKEAIYRELVLQDFVLELLTIQLGKNLKIIQDNQEERLVRAPYVDIVPINNPNLWIENRRNIRTITLSIGALTNANQASEEFKNAFKLLLEDKLTISRANALLSDIESLLNVAEKLKQVTNPSK